MSFNVEPHSGHEMVVDTDNMSDVLMNEKDDIAIISPGPLSSDSMDSVTDIVRADDFERMKELVLPPLIEEPEIIADAVNTWEIKGWRSLSKKERGPIFECGGSPWRVLMFPFGNNVSHCSFYLEHGFGDDPIPDDWYCCVQFGLVLWNPKDPQIFSHHTAHHRFNKEEGDWGFTRFVEINKLFTPQYDSPGDRPLVEDESALMTAYVRVVKDETGVLWHSFTNYDSKKETGYVGLKNQGATCYLNSLLQSLYFTNAFRKAVYQIPTQNEADLMNSAYTLQRLFYQLQTSQVAVSTNELTKSFGWETRHVFEQQDVQELSRKLMERLEERMKGTEAQDVLPKLFCGKVKTYISCTNVDYESSRVEDFWDIQLNVSGNKSLEDSFKDYVQVEKMDGDNQYFAGDEYKLQDADKGVIFQSFPEVLHLQLKRFEYDFERDVMMKINDRYEFPEIFDASPYLDKDADISEPYIYQLHGVLVHSGDLNAGHYYAFLKPTKDGHFYKYDDDKVTRATMREVLEDNYGGEVVSLANGNMNKVRKMQSNVRQNSAYMLVYIRQTRAADILLPINDAPPHIEQNLLEEQRLREAKRKEREEAHLYAHVRIINNETFAAHSGCDLGTFPESIQKIESDPAAAKYYKVLKTTTIADLAKQIGEELKADPRVIRFWQMVNRQNKTTRPDVPLLDERITVAEIMSKQTSKINDLRLWTEVAELTNEKGEPIWPNLPAGVPPKNDNMLLFLKCFDVSKQTLYGAGTIYVNHDKKVEDLVPLILERMKWPEKSASGEKTQLRLYEEIKPQMIEPMKSKQTLRAAELQDGDIICFQLDTKTVDEKMQKDSDFLEDAVKYYDYMLYTKSIRFTPHNRSYASYTISLDIPISLRSSYDQVASKVGEKLQVDPTHLRFWTVSASTNSPKTAIKPIGQTLQQMLNPAYTTYNNNQKTDQLVYEVLDVSLSELENKKSLKVTWLYEGITKDETYDLLVPKDGTVSDVIAALVKRANLDSEATKGPIRLYEVSSHKITREFQRNHRVAVMNEFGGLVAERIPQDEISVPPSDLINVFHYQVDPLKVHGVPFRFRIKQEELFSDTKKRLEIRTGIKGKNFEKIKFSLVRRGLHNRPQPISDDDLLWDLATDEMDTLGLDHIDRGRVTRGGGGDVFIK